MECIHFCRVLNPAEYTKRHSKMKMKFIDYDHEITMITINEWMNEMKHKHNQQGTRAPQGGRWLVL